MSGRPWPPPPDWDEPVDDWPQVVYRADRYHHLPVEVDDIQVAYRDRRRDGES